jgi:hypothetical protein
MRHGLTVVPAGLVLILVVALLGAGGDPKAPPAHGAAPLDDRFGMQTQPIYLLMRPDVQLDLKLDQRQITGARELVGRLVERLLSLKQKSGQDAEAERKSIDEAMAIWLNGELSEVQFDRLMQIQLQWEGASALHRPSVADLLGLGEAQRLKIGLMLAERDRRRAAGKLAPGEFEKLSRAAMGVLNPLQKQQWDEMLGPPCRFNIGHHAPAAGNPSADPDVKGQPQPQPPAR